MNEFTYILNSIVNWEWAKERIVPVLTADGDLKHDRMVVQMNGFNVRFVLPVINEDEGVVSVSVSDNMVSRWGVTERDVLRVALSNVKPMYVNFLDVLNGDLAPRPIDSITKEAVSEVASICITNDSLLNGACSILVPGVVSKLCEVMECKSVYVSFTSKNEAMVSPGDKDTLDALKATLVETVLESCPKEDFLSMNVFEVTPDLSFSIA